jgi:hypothetical protein
VAVEAGGEAIEDRACGADRQLLARDRADERAVEVGGPPGVVGLEGERAAALVDQPREDGVGAAKVLVGVRQGWPATAPGTPVFVE